MKNDKMTIKEIEALLTGQNVDEGQLAALREDPRAAVASLLRHRERQQKEYARVTAMYAYEKEFYRQGHLLVAGVDEAGRGPLAGPLSIAAVILPQNFYLPKINDSKKLSAKTREELFQRILETAVAVRHVFVDEKTIDRLNIYEATRQGMLRLLEELQPEAALIDAVPLDALTIPHISLIKGDAKSASIAAASIIAKVKRDHLMETLDCTYPVYGFASNKGYGTREHMEAIRQWGPCPIHRRSFEPIKSWGN